MAQVWEWWFLGFNLPRHTQGVAHRTSCAVSPLMEPLVQPPPPVPMHRSPPPQLSFNMDENAVPAMVAWSNGEVVRKLVCFCLHLFAFCDFRPPEFALEGAMNFVQI